MFCPKCGKENAENAQFCSSCGARITVAASPSYNTYNGMKQPPKLVPFLLGMFLGIIGIVIAILVYNGNYGEYTENPTTSALLWSIIGMLIWIPIIALLVIVPIMLAGPEMILL